MDDDSAQAGTYKVAIAIFTALLTAAIGQGILVWRDASVLSSRVSELRSAVDANTESLRVLGQIANSNAIHRYEHERQADHWIKQIEENERNVQDLLRNSGARPDPFTGTQGRALDDRIRRLEGDLK